MPLCEVGRTIRSMTQTAPLQYVIGTGRAARVLSPRGRFLAGQIGTATRRYALADGHVHIRHRSRDIAILNEIWSRRSYSPPIEIGGTLDVLDLGGNIGLFGLLAFTRWDVTRLRSYEPDPADRKSVV